MMKPRKKRPVTKPIYSRGTRFPPEMDDWIRKAALDTQRTFSDMVIYLCARGIEALENDERDRAEGRKLREEHEQKRKKG